MTNTVNTYSGADGRVRAIPYDDTAGNLTSFVVLDGGPGTSYAANLPAPSGTLLATIPASPGRAAVLIENQSAADITVYGDDGAGTNLWATILVGVGAGLRGGDFYSPHFRGRLRVYGTAGSRISAVEF